MRRLYSGLVIIGMSIAVLAAGPRVSERDARLELAGITVVRRPAR